MLVVHVYSYVTGLVEVTVSFRRTKVHVHVHVKNYKS